MPGETEIWAQNQGLRAVQPHCPVKDRGQSRCSQHGSMPRASRGTPLVGGQVRSQPRQKGIGGACLEEAVPSHGFHALTKHCPGQNQAGSGGLGGTKWQSGQGSQEAPCPEVSGGNRQTGVHGMGKKVVLKLEGGTSRERKGTLV